jgi:tetratricopeptide (TPR) repeat protein
MKEMGMLQTPKQKSNQDSRYMILLVDDECLFSPQFRHSETINRCEIADQWRAMGYIRHAICYYTWLIERLSMLDDPEFVKLHKSRLHNNLAACYQDLDDDQTALYHYRLSLDILSSDEEHKSMQAAIIHYNIALIHTNCNEIDEAQKHLHNSLSHFSGLPNNQNSTLDVSIYIAFAKLYEQSNEWQMAREYYERVLDQFRQDIPDNPIIAKYEKRLQYIIDKISEST